MTGSDDSDIPDFKEQQFKYEELLEELEQLVKAFESPWMARTNDEWHINKQRAQELQEIIAEYRDNDS